MRNIALLVTAAVLALGETPEKETAHKSYWKRLTVASINPQARTMAVREPGLEISWDKTTRFFRHRSVPLKDLKQNTVLHVFGKLHSPRQPGSTSGESLITDVAYIGTGDGFEQPPLTPGNQLIAWHTGSLRASRPPYYLKIGDAEYRLAVEEDVAAYSLEKIAPQALAGKPAFVRGSSEKVAADAGGKAHPVTRVLAREAHLLELNAKHAKVFQLQWAEERKTGTGLLGDYFDNTDLTGLKISRMDATVDFDWGTGAPDPSLGSDNFSVRWTGQIKAPFTETFTFYTFTDDGVRLWVNNQPLVDKWVGQVSTEWTGSIALVAGQKYDIRMEYFDGIKNAVARLLWSSPSIERQVIPQSQLYPPPVEPVLPVAPTKLTASVAREHSVALTWTQSATPGITQNKVYRSAKSGGPYELLATLSATTSYEDKTAAGASYYVVTTISQAGESGFSNQAFVKAESK